jgi:hypothetical protein
MVNRGMMFPRRIDPLTIQIDHRKIASIIADNNTIDI